MAKISKHILASRIAKKIIAECDFQRPELIEPEDPQLKTLREKNPPKVEDKTKSESGVTKPTETTPKGKDVPKSPSDKDLKAKYTNLGNYVPAKIKRSDKDEVPTTTFKFDDDLLEPEEEKELEDYFDKKHIIKLKEMIAEDWGYDGPDRVEIDKADNAAEEAAEREEERKSEEKWDKRYNRQSIKAHTQKTREQNKTKTEGQVNELSPELISRYAHIRHGQAKAAHKMANKLNKSGPSMVTIAKSTPDVNAGRLDVVHGMYNKAMNGMDASYQAMKRDNAKRNGPPQGELNLKSEFIKPQPANAQHMMSQKKTGMADFWKEANEEYPYNGSEKDAGDETAFTAAAERAIKIGQEKKNNALLHKHIFGDKPSVEEAKTPKLGKTKKK